MADKDIIIGVKTTGTASAGKEIRNLKEETSGLGQQVRKTDEQFDTAAKTGNTFTASAVNMRSAVSNLGFQLQDMAVQAEMGVSPLRIISQQLPQLLGGFGAYGAIAGAAIGIGVPLAASLFKLGDGADESANQIGKLNDELDDLKEAYEGIYKSIGEDQAEAAKQSAKALADTLRGFDRDQKSQGDSADITAAKLKASEELALARERNRLAEIERALVTATGEAAVRLAKERETRINNIYETEMRIAGAGRQQELEKANAAVGKAGKALGATAVNSQSVAAELAKQQAQQDELLNKTNELRGERLKKLDEVIDNINKQADAAIKRAQQMGQYESISMLESQRNGRIDDARGKYGLPGDAEKRAAAEAAGMQSLIDQLKSQSEAANAAQQAAAEALQQAAADLLKLREMQQNATAFDGLGKKEGQLGDLGKQVTGSADKAIGLINQSTPGGGFVDYAKQEALKEINKIKNDNVPDSEQSQELLSALQMLANSLTGKDKILADSLQSMIKDVKTMVDRYNTLKGDIDDLKGKINQKK